MFNKTRIEIFTDGILAIIITIMVLDIKAPATGDLSLLMALAPKFFSYMLSFVYIGIYWNNHHHMFALVDGINWKIMLSNFNLLFWISLIPFTTSWLGETNFAEVPSIAYGVILLLAAIAYRFLEKQIIKTQGVDSKLKKAIGNVKKEWLSIFLYLAGIIIGFFLSLLSFIIYIGVAVFWIIPDKRIEKVAK